MDLDLDFGWILMDFDEAGFYDTPFAHVLLFLDGRQIRLARYQGMEIGGGNVENRLYHTHIIFLGPFWASKKNQNLFYNSDQSSRLFMLSTVI
jgi:hypothetical protein